MPSWYPDASRRAYASERDFETLPQSFVIDAERSAQKKREQRTKVDTEKLGEVKDEGKKTKGGQGTKPEPAKEAEPKRPAVGADGEK